MENKSITEIRTEALKRTVESMTHLVNSDIMSQKTSKMTIQVRDMLEPKYGKAGANFIVSHCTISIPEDFDVDLSELIMLYVQYICKIIDTYEAEGFTKEQIIRIYNNFQFIMS